MAKGDQVAVTYRVGDSAHVDQFLVAKSGRTIEISLEKDSGTTWLEVHEQTRGGTTTTKARYQLSEVIAYKEAKKAMVE